MVHLETVEELAESLADLVGVYGCLLDDTGFSDHPADCKCRICFVSDITERIRQVMKTPSIHEEITDSMFHTREQRDKIRRLNIGSGVLIYRDAPNEVAEIEFFINRKTSRLCYLKDQQEVVFTR